MSALPDKLPPKQRKPQSKRQIKATQSDIAIAPRSLQEIDAPFRGGDNWTAIPRSYDSDRVRLASGVTFWALTTYLTHLSGRDRQAGEQLSFEAEFSIPEAALWCRCNERSIDRELLYLSQRDMAIVARLAGRRVLVRLMVRPEQVGDKQYPGWQNIPQSYVEWAAAQRQSLDEQQAELERENDNPVVRLTKTRVRPGHQSEAQQVDCHIKSLRVKCPKDSPIDIELSGKVVSGELVVSVSGIAQEVAESTRNAKPVKSTTSDQTSRHTRLENAKLPANEGISKYPYMRVHKRAEELAAIWDPILYRKLQLTLTANKQYLRNACIAVDQTPIEIIREKAERRAQKHIKRVSDVVEICREIRINWEKGKELPAPERGYTREEIDAMIEVERAELAAKRRALRGAK